jgi:hypothetical protein
MTLYFPDSTAELRPRSKLCMASDVGHDEADIEALGGRLNARSHAPLAAPGLGTVTRLGIAGDHWNPRLGAANPHIVSIQFHQAVEQLVARQTKDVVHVVGLAPRHHLRAPMMTVAADGQTGLRRMLAGPVDQAAHMVADFSAGRRRGGPY